MSRRSSSGASQLNVEFEIHILSIQFDDPTGEVTEYFYAVSFKRHGTAVNTSFEPPIPDLPGSNTSDEASNGSGNQLTPLKGKYKATFNDSFNVSALLYIEPNGSLREKTATIKVHHRAIATRKSKVTELDAEIVIRLHELYNEAMNPQNVSYDFKTVAGAIGVLQVAVSMRNAKEGGSTRGSGRLMPSKSRRSVTDGDWTPGSVTDGFRSVRTLSIGSLASIDPDSFDSNHTTVASDDASVSGLTNTPGNDSGKGASIALLGLSKMDLTVEDKIMMFQEIVRKYPNDFEAHSTFANFLRETNRLNESIAEYRQALQINSNDQRALFSLAGCHKELGQLDEAISVYRSAVRIDVTKVFSDEFLSVLSFSSSPILNEKSREEGIGKQLELPVVSELTTIGKDCIRAFYKAYSIENYELTVAVYYEGVDAVGPRYGICVMPHAAHAFLQLHRDRESIEEYFAALTGSSYDSSISKAFTNFCMKCGNLEMVSSLWSQTKTHPTNSQIRRYLADYYTSVAVADRDVQRSMEQLEKALSLDPCHRDALTELNKVYVSLHRVRDAISTFDQLIALKDDSACVSKARFVYSDSSASLIVSLLTNAKKINVDRLSDNRMEGSIVLLTENKLAAISKLIEVFEASLSTQSTADETLNIYSPKHLLQQLESFVIDVNLFIRESVNASTPDSLSVSFVDLGRRFLDVSTSFTSALQTAQQNALAIHLQRQEREQKVQVYQMKLQHQMDMLEKDMRHQLNLWKAKLLDQISPIHETDKAVLEQYFNGFFETFATAYANSAIIVRDESSVSEEFLIVGILANAMAFIAFIDRFDQRAQSISDVFKSVNVLNKARRIHTLFDNSNVLLELVGEVGLRILRSVEKQHRIKAASNDNNVLIDSEGIFNLLSQLLGMSRESLDINQSEDKCLSRGYKLGNSDATRLLNKWLDIQDFPSDRSQQISLLAKLSLEGEGIVAEADRPVAESGIFGAVFRSLCCCIVM